MYAQNHRCGSSRDAYMIPVGHGTRGLILKLIGVVSAYDNTLFLRYNAIGNLFGILSRHVDDSIYCGNEMFKRKCEYRTKKINLMPEIGTVKFGRLNVSFS